MFDNIQYEIQFSCSSSNFIFQHNTWTKYIKYNKAYPGYCKHVLCRRPPEKAFVYRSGGSKMMQNMLINATARHRGEGCFVIYFVFDMIKTTEILYQGITNRLHVLIIIEFFIQD